MICFTFPAYCTPNHAVAAHHLYDALPSGAYTSCHCLDGAYPLDRNKHALSLAASDIGAQGFAGFWYGSSPAGR